MYFPHWLSRFSLALVIVVIAALALVACKNISHPLLWSDESETIMTAQQITLYGYPKVHDGKNTVFIPDNSLWLGYKPSADAYIAITWGSFYYAAIGVWLAQLTPDIYLKTAILRLQFALAGLLGLAIFAITMRRFFANKVSFRFFTAAFLVLEMLSVNLLLHIREARYYPLVILITACYFYVFAAFHFHRRLSRTKYIILLTAILVIAFNINFIAFGSMCATTGLYLCYCYFNSLFSIQKALSSFNLKHSLVLATPLLMAGILVLPGLIFFETFKTAQLADIYYHKSLGKFLQQLCDLFAILLRFELLPAMLIIKVIRTGFEYFLNKSKPALIERTERLKEMSFFMLLFFIIYALLTARMPFIFTRYFIVLQPVLVLILLTDVLIVFDYATALSFTKIRLVRTAVIVFFACICFINTALCDNHITDYCYQITHPLHGPLDYYIPAIKERFPHPENLVIATNYEEMSYEYYLGCKVILGFQNHFISVDKDTGWQQYRPDVIILRPSWYQDNRPYKFYFQHAQYKKITFPVKDQPVNDVTDLYFFMKHHFRTVFAEGEDDRAAMYVKDGVW